VRQQVDDPAFDALAADIELVGAHQAFADGKGFGMGENRDRLIRRHFTGQRRDIFLRRAFAVLRAEKAGMAAKTRAGFDERHL
jgi:hypothetical protein